MLDLTNLRIIKRLLSETGSQPRKQLGQHFLLSRRAIGSAIRAAELSDQDTVLEIGPGLGALTLELAKRVKKVIAVEYDKKVAEILYENIKTLKHENIKVINQDTLKFLISQLQTPSFKIVANLPYQITSPVLWKFLHGDADRRRPSRLPISRNDAERPLPTSPWQGEGKRPELMVIMVQREVAQRLVAQPGQMSILSVLVQYYAEARIVKQVKRMSFYPMPEVDSVIIKLEVRSKKLEVGVNEDVFFKLVKAGFASKRKMLKNNLSKLVSGNLSEVLSKAGILEKARAQELSVADWLRLYKVLYTDGSRSL